MPKAIEGAHDAILEAARRLLLSEGYQGLGMRSIAAECGLALGTLYHYYHAKDEIVYALMESDWKIALAGMDKDTALARAGVGGHGAAMGSSGAAGGSGAAGPTADLLLRLFSRLSGFTRSYAEIWKTIALLPPQEKSPTVRCYDRGVFMREFGARIESAIGALGSGAGGADEGQAGANVACLAVFIARMFSAYAMDAEPDTVTLGCVLRRLLTPRD